MLFRSIAAAALCVFMGAATANAADSFTPAQTRELERIVHDYIIKHPEVLMESIQAAEEKEKADKVARAEHSIHDQEAALLHDPESQVGGNPNGDVTIVEFFDYRCPYCKQVEPVLESLLASDRKLRIVYKEFPILGPASTYASRIALASRAQGKYDAFHRAMMGTKGSIDEKVVDRVARSVGIDIDKARSDMNGPGIEAVIKKDFALADAININGTPAFIIAGKLYPGAMTMEELKKAIADARQAHAG